MKLTPARRRGLAVLAQHRVARESNVTDEVVGYVYWQTSQWLIREGLARFLANPPERITEQLARRLLLAITATRLEEAA